MKRRSLTPLLLLALSSAALAAEPPFGVIVSTQAAGTYGPTVGGAGLFEVDGNSSSANPQIPATAFARASLKTGTLGVYADCTMAYTPPVGDPWAHSGAIATAGFWDTITLTADDVNLGLIPLRLELDGSTNGTGIALYSLNVYSLDDQKVVFTGSWLTKGNAVLDTHLFDDLLAPATERHYRIDMYMEADVLVGPNYGGMTGTASFGNTLHFKWDLPEGVHFSSASGVFNPERIHPVPEPMTCAALGAGALVTLRRRSRR